MCTVDPSMFLPPVMFQIPAAEILDPRDNRYVCCDKDLGLQAGAPETRAAPFMEGAASQTRTHPRSAKVGRAFDV
jgi:hypothetical protein